MFQKLSKLKCESCNIALSAWPGAPSKPNTSCLTSLVEIVATCCNPCSGLFHFEVGPAPSKKDFDRPGIDSAGLGVSQKPRASVLVSVSTNPQMPPSNSWVAFKFSKSVERSGKKHSTECPNVRLSDTSTWGMDFCQAPLAGPCLIWVCLKIAEPRKWAVYGRFPYTPHFQTKGLGFRV